MRIEPRPSPNPSTASQNWRARPHAVQPAARAGRGLHVALGFLLLDVITLVAHLAAAVTPKPARRSPCRHREGGRAGIWEQSLGDAQNFKYIEG